MKNPQGGGRPDPGALQKKGDAGVKDRFAEPERVLRNGWIGSPVFASVMFAEGA